VEGSITKTANGAVPLWFSCSCKETPVSPMLLISHYNSRCSWMNGRTDGMEGEMDPGLFYKIKSLNTLYFVMRALTIRHLQACFKLRSSGSWRRVVLWQDTIVSEVHAASIFRVNCRWRQQGALERWYPTTTPHGVTTQKTSTWTNKPIHTLK
jgi:hypothetical protein